MKLLCLISILWSFSSWATEMEVQIVEEIKSDVFGYSPAELEGAKKSHAENCETWKASLKDVSAAALVFSDCGGRRDAALRMSWTVLDHDFNGNPFHSTHYTNPYSYLSYSQGKALVISNKFIREFKNSLRGDSYSCKLANLTDCREQRRLAELSYRVHCEDWKARARKDFGSRFVLATCGISQNEAGSVDSSRYGFRLASEGTVYYLLE